MVVNKEQAVPYTWHLSGADLREVCQYDYLGVTVTASANPV